MVCGKCKYTKPYKRTLNLHKKVCQKYLDSKLSLFEKESVSSCGPSVEHKKMKFAQIGRNPRHVGRKVHMITNARNAK